MKVPGRARGVWARRGHSARQGRGRQPRAPSSLPAHAGKPPKSSQAIGALAPEQVLALAPCGLGINGWAKAAERPGASAALGTEGTEGAERGLSWQSSSSSCPPGSSTEGWMTPRDPPIPLSLAWPATPLQNGAGDLPTERVAKPGGIWGSPLSATQRNRRPEIKAVGVDTWRWEDWE